MGFFLTLQNDYLLIYLLSCISVILLMFSSTVKVNNIELPAGLVSFVMMLLAAYLFGYLELVGLFWVGLLMFSGYLYQRNIYRNSMLFFLLVLAFLLAIHALPGFDNPLILNQVQLSQAASPYTLHINLDKFSAGIILFWFVLDQRERYPVNIRQIQKVGLVAAITIFISIVVAMQGMIEFDYKISVYFLVFAISNLFFTCMAEEAYFRGLIQKPLSNFMHPAIAIIISAILFALAHFGAARIDYILSSFIAGIGYAYVYYKTQSVIASMLMHWVLNMLHFVFFTYPFLL